MGITDTIEQEQDELQLLHIDIDRNREPVGGLGWDKTGYPETQTGSRLGYKKGDRNAGSINININRKGGKEDGEKWTE